MKLCHQASAGIPEPNRNRGSMMKKRRTGTETENIWTSVLEPEPYRKAFPGTAELQFFWQKYFKKQRTKKKKIH